MSMSMSLLVLQGANLSHLGRREPAIYGSETLLQLNERLAAHGVAAGCVVVCRQSNHEGALIDWLLAADDEGFAGVVLNAGAWAHTSLAIADAVRSIAPLPVVEVHLSNTVARDELRHTAVVGAACRGRIEGFGVGSYLLAIDALIAVVGARW